MIKELNLKDVEVSKSVVELQKTSYKIEAKLINFYEIPPLNDTIDKLQECDEIFYGYYINDDLSGIISFKIVDNVLDIHRVAVHPTYFRMGIANELINFIERINDNVNKVVVCTGKENIPAINLYVKNGYKKKDDIEIKNGIYITEFEKILR